ncbi:MAG: hypothetical protein K2M70_09925 [Lachnospiraceae bacterium]|nr:hypothetical protein [Lachnospiraceae bacterium]
MTYRKTWFSYVLWVAYAGLCVMLLSYTGYHIYAGYVALPLARLGALIIFPVLVCVYLALRLISQAIRKRHSVSLYARAMLEAAVVSISFVFGLLYRLRVLLYTTVDSASIESVTGDYYERALIRAGEQIEPMAHGLSQLYVTCLSAVFSFLGNGVTSAMLFQIILQMAAMVLAFRIVKKAARRLPACVVLLSLAFSDTFVAKIAVIDPECFYLVLYLLGLLVILGFIKGYLLGKPVLGGLPGAVFAGVFIGVLIYLELWSVTLLFFLVGLFTGKREREDRISGRILHTFMTVASCAGSFLVVIGVDAALSGVSFERSIQVWAYPYSLIRWNGFLFDTVKGDSLFWALLVLFAAFLVFEFLRGDREQNYTLWMFVCVLFTPVLMMDLDRIGYGSILLFFWSMMAGLGLKNCILAGQAEVMRAKIQEINASVGEDAIQEVKAATEMAEKNAAEQPMEKPRYIENPLPVPKKHVKREMDYDHEVPESAMHFDIEIEVGDDFELN